ncbi:hypothetical protein A0257_18285 [Hymenobacter psoromatis]|nr:hypothetical protein A0257_18285 [Hymenobacter psoromatis]
MFDSSTVSISIGSNGKIPAMIVWVVSNQEVGHSKQATTTRGPRLAIEQAAKRAGPGLGSGGELVLGLGGGRVLMLALAQAQQGGQQ